MMAAASKYAKSLPPGPRTPPSLQMLRWIREPFAMMSDCRSRFGDAFTLNLPALPHPVVLVADPLAVKDVFALGSDQGHAGKANAVLKPLVGEHSLLLLDGAEHLRQRKMILPAFHGERMHGYGRAMMDLTHESIDRWPVGTPFAVHKKMQAVTLQVILRTIFGMEAGPRFVELAELLTSALDIATHPLLLLPLLQRDLGRLSPWGRFLRIYEQSSRILRAEIRRGRQAGTTGRTDVLAMMLDARDEAGQPLSEDEVHDELVTLLIAGHETTATALAWTLRWLLPDADRLGRLREELASAGGNPQRVAKLALLDATVKEALRLQPVVPLVGRLLVEPATFGEVELPANTFVAPAIYLVHRRPSLYPEPACFRPERFLDDGTSAAAPQRDHTKTDGTSAAAPQRGHTKKDATSAAAPQRGPTKVAPWEWLPFGGGMRKCVGAAFAMYEMKMALASILPRVEMRLASERVRVVRRGVTMAPSKGLPVVVTAKRPREASGARVAA